MRHPDDPQPIIADAPGMAKLFCRRAGRVDLVTILIFFCLNLGKTAAELPMEQKNQISHRGKALARLVESIKEETFSGLV